jgi:hypothetical protein
VTGDTILAERDTREAARDRRDGGRRAYAAGVGNRVLTLPPSCLTDKIARRPQPSLLLWLVGLQNVFRHHELQGLCLHFCEPLSGCYRFQITEPLALSVGLDQSLCMEEETILALYLYFQLSFGKLHSGNPEIQQLAAALGRLNNSAALHASDSLCVGLYSFLVPFQGSTSPRVISLLFTAAQHIGALTSNRTLPGICLGKPVWRRVKLA